MQDARYQMPDAGCRIWFQKVEGVSKSPQADSKPLVVREVACALLNIMMQSRFIRRKHATFGVLFLSPARFSCGPDG